jgi:hypothetical protein
VLLILDTENNGVNIGIEGWCTQDRRVGIHTIANVVDSLI